MNSREFRTIAAGKAKTALVGAGLLGLTFAGSIQAEPPAGGTTSAPGQVVTASLEYREVNYSFINLYLQVNPVSSAFKKEPPFRGSKVARGKLQLGAGASNELAFAWDRAAGKLYLDLNRNLDLTDDPAGVFACPKGPVEYYQSFTNVHLPLKTAVVDCQALVDLNFYGYDGLNCSAAMRSFWQGKLILQGQELQAGVLANPSEGARLLLRPWNERNSAFSIANGSLETFLLPQRLFFDGQAYGLQWASEAHGNVTTMRLQFTEQESSLGELKITGKFIQRLTLEGGPYPVVLDKPEAMVRVPSGTYGQASVCLKNGSVEAHLEHFAPARITVNDKTPAVFVGGGPLTNSVSISRQGKNLRLNYQLLGAGGVYQLVSQDRSHPPEFTIYQSDKKVASGKFEFG